MSDQLIVGCGYLGARVARLWREAGHRVFATTRRAERAEELRQLGLEPIVCDVLRRETLSALPSVATVLHCVGFDRGAGVPMRDVYVTGLSNVAAAVAGRSARFLHVSSTSVYGQRDGGWVDETSATEPVDVSGRIVLDAERELRKHRPDAIVLRFAGIIGPGRLLRAKALRAGEPLTLDADVWLNLIHVEDGAAAVLAAEARGRPGEVYNVTDGRPTTRREFYTRLAEVLGAPVPQFLVPKEPERANRRIGNRRLTDELSVVPRPNLASIDA